MTPRMFLIVATLVVSSSLLNAHHAKAEIVESPPTCSDEFISDFDTTAELFLSVGLVIDSKADDHAYRSSVVTALNSCHAFVAKYVTVDPMSNDWSGQVCTREVETGSVTIEPRSHKAECEYLQRLLNRADQ